MRVDIMIVVAAILVPTRGYSQDYSCDYGQVQSEGWSGSCEPCSGNDPTEEHLCDYTINIRQTLSCQSSNWRGTQFGSWQSTNLIAFGACGPVQENDQPLCTPEKSFPAYMGVQYAGGSKLTFKTTYSAQAITANVDSDPVEPAGTNRATILQ